VDDITPIFSKPLLDPPTFVTPPLPASFTRHHCLHCQKAKPLLLSTSQPCPALSLSSIHYSGSLEAVLTLSPNSTTTDGVARLDDVLPLGFDYCYSALLAGLLCDGLLNTLSLQCANSCQVSLKRKFCVAICYPVQTWCYPLKSFYQQICMLSVIRDDSILQFSFLPSSNGTTIIGRLGA
jgi:hypothetical protein